MTGLERTNKVFLPRYLRRGVRSQLPNRTVFSFFMNQKATFTIVFKQLRKGRLVTRGRLVREGTMGKNRVRFVGKLPRPKGGIQFLSPGPCRAFFTSRNEFGSSPTSVIGFRIAKPPRR